MGITIMAMSVIDIALCDSFRRTLGQPLWKRNDNPTSIYGSGFFRGLGHDGMIEKTGKFVEQGFKSIKMQMSYCFTNMDLFDHSWVNPIMPIDGFMVPLNRPEHGMDFKPEVINS
jgi:hypothetical protein